MLKKISLTIIIISGALGLTERSTYLISKLVGDLTCGANYMQAVDGLLCGYNVEVYVTIALYTSMFVGLFLFLFGAMRAPIPEDEQQD